VTVRVQVILLDQEAFPDHVDGGRFPAPQAGNRHGVRP